MRALLCFLVVAAIAGVGLSGEIDKLLRRPDPIRTVAMAASSSLASPASHGRTVKLERDRRGHFQVDARVDGRPVDFMVDTGASMVVLRESAAARLGIFPRASDYTGQSQTANGVARFAPVRLGRIDVDGIAVHDVAAAVMPDEALAVNLLGMSYLSRVKWTHDHGRLVLEQ